MTKKATAHVVPFPGPASSSGDKAVRAKRANTALIRECVIYAQSIAAHDAGFNVDPDGNMIHAAPLGDYHIDRAHQALVKISRIPVTTAEGLQAKARIVRALEKHEEAFLLSFAADVKAFLEPTIDEHWHADLAAKTGNVAS
jgi:hypothetical protein